MRQNTFHTSTSHLSTQPNRMSTYQSMIIPKGRVSASKLLPTEQAQGYERTGSPSKTISEIQEVKQKIFQISKILAQHTKDISILKQNKESFSNYSSCDTLRGSNQSDTFKEVHKEIDSVLLDFQAHLSKQIHKLKVQLLDIVPSRQQVHSITRALQIKIDSFNTNPKFNFINKQIVQIKTKITQDNILIREELACRIKNLHEANRKVFAQIERDMKQFNIQIQKLSDNTNIFASNKKFHSPIIVKYKEFLERIGEKQQVILNEMTYYLDNQGHLLDNSCLYLVGKDGKELQLSKKHIDLLKFHHILS